jgi:aldehyde:ferredoxin oxidoreductase
MGAAGVAIAMAVGGGLLKAKGNYDAGTAEMNLNDHNALLMRRSATDAIARGSYESSQATAEGTKMIASENAVTGASGFDVGDNTALGVIDTTRGTSALNAEMIRNNALREALGFRAQANEFDFKSKMAKRSRNFGVATDLLGMGTQAVSMGSFPRVGAGGK